MSMDDFYKTKKDQDSLAAAHPANPMLQYRGNAGSHDLHLLAKTLSALTGAAVGAGGGGGGGAEPECSGHGRFESSMAPVGGDAVATAAAAATTTDITTTVVVPRYDKALYGGRGDREPDLAKWTHVQTPVDVVLFEGWMLGFSAIEQSQAEAMDAAGPAPVVPPLFPSAIDMTGYAEVNRILGGDAYQDLHRQFDSWVVLGLSNVDHVFEWRCDAEQAQGNGLSESDVRDFVARFMPSYRACLDGLYRDGPVGVLKAGLLPPEDVLHVTVGADRLPVEPVVPK
jgi:D-glycerate 3-kinase